MPIPLRTIPTPLYHTGDYVLVHCDYCQDKVLAYVSGTIDDSYTLVIVGSGDMWTDIHHTELSPATYADIKHTAHEYHNVALLALAHNSHVAAIQ